MKSIFYKPILDMDATGKRIKSLRISSGLSVKTVQDIFSFPTPQAVYNWERGKNMPSIDNLIVLAEIFGVSIEDIVRTKSVGIEIGEENIFRLTA